LKDSNFIEADDARALSFSERGNTTDPRVH
jgi:hypothetical protein